MTEARAKMARVMSPVWLNMQMAHDELPKWRGYDWNMHPNYWKLYAPIKLYMQKVTWLYVIIVFFCGLDKYIICTVQFDLV